MTSPPAKKQKYDFKNPNAEDTARYQDIEHRFLTSFLQLLRNVSADRKTHVIIKLKHFLLLRRGRGSVSKKGQTHQYCEQFKFIVLFLLHIRPPLTLLILHIHSSDIASSITSDSYGTSQQLTITPHVRLLFMTRLIQCQSLHPLNR